MKYIKKFENKENKPESGDYVYCKLPKGESTPNEFFGILKIDTYSHFPYKVELLNTEEEKNVLVRPEEIMFFTKNIEDIKMYMDSLKYNL